MHGPFQPYAQHRLHSDFSAGPVSPDQMRWSPLPMPESPTDFVDGLYTMAGNGGPEGQYGVGIVIDFFGLAGKYSGFPVDFV